MDGGYLATFEWAYIRDSVDCDDVLVLILCDASPND